MMGESKPGFSRAGLTFDSEIPDLLSRLGLDGFRLVYKHNRNIVPDFIKEVAFLTDEAVPGFIQVNVPLTFGAGQDIQQFLTDRHGSLLIKV